MSFMSLLYVVICYNCFVAVTTSAIDWLERLVSEMTRLSLYDLLCVEWSKTLNPPVRSLTHSLESCSLFSGQLARIDLSAVECYHVSVKAMCRQP